MNDELGWISAASFKRPVSTPRSAWTTHGAFAFWLVENLKPDCIVELGALAGYSYLCFCQQVLSSKLPARCYAVDTWEGDEHNGFYGDAVLAKLRAAHDPKYGAFSKLIRSTFDEAVLGFEDKSIDLLHVDGRHFYDDVKHDFEKWKPKLSDRAVVLFHDTQVRTRDFGVWRFWEELSRESPSFEFYHGHGLGVLCFGTDPVTRNLPIFSPALYEGERSRIRAAYETLGNVLAGGVKLLPKSPCPCGSGVRLSECHGMPKDSEQSLVSRLLRRVLGGRATRRVERLMGFRL